ncbi:MAG: DUF2786 domain-containing protein [Nocardioidaceae bacterium]
MGVNNRQRRAAKQRKRAKARAGAHPRPGAGEGQTGHWGGPYQGDFGGTWGADGPWQEWDEQTTVEHQVYVAVRQTVDSSRGAAAAAGALLSANPRVRVRRIATATERLLARTVTQVVRSGWTPSDLVETTRRGQSKQAHRHLRMLAALLEAEAAQYPYDRVHPQWQAELADVARPELGDLSTVGSLTAALELAAILSVLPEIEVTLPAPGATAVGGRGSTGAGSRQLARVRALLAKAESTDFPDEAETLSAKAQELISRYALDRLVAEQGDQGAAPAATVRRVWIDAPYVHAKAMLVNVVAEANGCRTVLSEKLGFSTVLGATDDLDAVEMLATSLLVQADNAMLQHGRQVDRWGSSRTRSFRKAFLVAYATRIGERLQGATDDAVEQSGKSGQLVPLLQARQERAEALMGELFPDLQRRGTSVTNGEGWAAGRAAADLARLDPNLTSVDAGT